MTSVTVFLNRLIWSPGLVGLILGVGLFLSIRTGFVQLTLFPAAHFGVISGSGTTATGDFLRAAGLSWFVHQKFSFLAKRTPGETGVRGKLTP